MLYCVDQWSQFLYGSVLKHPLFVWDHIHQHRGSNTTDSTWAHSVDDKMCGGTLYFLGSAFGFKMGKEIFG